MDKSLAIIIFLSHLIMFRHYSTPAKIISVILCLGTLIVLILSGIEDKKKEPDDIIDARNHN